MPDNQESQTLNEVASTTPPKKRKIWIYIVIALAILLLCCVVTGIIGFFIYLGQGNKNAQDKIDKAVSLYDEAIDEYNKFEKESYVAEKDFDFLDEDFSSKVKEDLDMLNDINDSFDEADSEFNDIKDIDGLDWEYDYADYYIDSIAEMDEAIKLINEILVDLDPLSQDLKVLHGSTNNYQNGINAINQALEYGNNSQYAQQKSKSLEAKTSFVEARKKYQQLQNKNKEYDLANYIKRATKAIELADIWIKAADAGSAGKTSTYNTYVKQFNEKKGELSGKITSKFIDNPDNWFTEQYQEKMDEIDSHVEEANKLKDKAEAQVPE